MKPSKKKLEDLKNQITKFEYDCLYQTGNDLTITYYLDVSKKFAFIHPEIEEQFLIFQETFSHN